MLVVGLAAQRKNARLDLRKGLKCVRVASLILLWYNLRYSATWIGARGVDCHCKCKFSRTRWKCIVFRWNLAYDLTRLNLRNSLLKGKLFVFFISPFKSLLRMDESRGILPVVEYKYMSLSMRKTEKFLNENCWKEFAMLWDFMLWG